MRMRRHGWISSAAGLCIVLATHDATGAPGDHVLLGASSDTHLWFVEQGAAPDGQVVLRHHALEMDGPYYTSGLSLSQVPAALAAWANHVWIVFPPKGDQKPSRRETFTVQVDRDPAFGGYSLSPHDRLGVVASLHGQGTLAGFVGTADGPVALLMPTERAGARVQGDAETIAAQPVLQGPTLLQLQGQGWTQLPLPESFAPDRLVRLGVGGQRGQVLVLLTESLVDRQRSTVYWRDAEGTWDGSVVPLELRSLRSLTRVETNVALVLEETSGSRRVRLEYLRPNSLLELARVSSSGDRWTVLGMRDGLRMIEQTNRGELTLRRLDPISGEASLSQPMVSQPLMPLGALHVPLLIAAAITALLFVFLFRPSAKAKAISLPPDLVTLGPMPRLLAIAVDLAASGLVTMAVFGYRPQELLRVPIWTVDLALATPALLMIAITVVHSTLNEIVSGRTLGKAMVGARVVTCNGLRASPLAVVTRNMFKALILLIPLLAVFALLNPHLQGLGDLVARTVVVRKAGEGSLRPSNDR